MPFLGFLDNPPKGPFSSSELKQVRLVFLSTGTDVAKKTNAWQIDLYNSSPRNAILRFEAYVPRSSVAHHSASQPSALLGPLAPSTALQSDYTLQVFYIRGQLHREIKHTPIYVFIFRDL